MTVAPDIVAALGRDMLDRGLQLSEKPIAAALATVRGSGFAPQSVVAGPVRSEDRDIPSNGHDVPVRLYWPDRKPLGMMVNIHGGGWVAGSIAGDDRHCRRLAEAAGCIILSVGYRLAPEHPFPAAIEDCVAAMRWARSHAAGLGAASGAIAVRGASAGANIAAAALLKMAEERDIDDIGLQLLLYPICDAGLDFPSCRENATGYFLTTQDLRWYWRQYIGDGDPYHPHASLLRAGSLSALPSALVITARYDPLRDEGEAFARRLTADGVETDYRCYSSAIHGFITLAPESQATARALQDCAEALIRAFSPNS